MPDLLKKGPLTDMLLNGLLPLVAGSILYSTRSILPTRSFIINQLPDGLWAYAFISCILIIWNRQINLFWIITAFLISILFEIFQYLQFITGTGDLWDMLTYFLAAGLALLFNKLFKLKFTQPPLRTNLL